MDINLLVFSYGNKSVSINGLQSIQFELEESKDSWDSRFDLFKSGQVMKKIVSDIVGSNLRHIDDMPPHRGTPHLIFKYNNGDREIIEFKTDNEVIDHYNELTEQLKTLHIMPGATCMKGEEK